MFTCIQQLQTVLDVGHSSLRLHFSKTHLRWTMQHKDLFDIPAHHLPLVTGPLSPAHSLLWGVWCYGLNMTRAASVGGVNESISWSLCVFWRGSMHSKSEQIVFVSKSTVIILVVCWIQNPVAKENRFPSGGIHIATGQSYPNLWKLWLFNFWAACFLMFRISFLKFRGHGSECMILCLFSFCQTLCAILLYLNIK